LPVGRNEGQGTRKDINFRICYIRFYCIGMLYFLLRIIKYFLAVSILISCGKVDREYYPNGNLKSKIELNRNGEINGLKTVYYENKQIQSIEHYSKNIENGEFRKYFSNGNIEITLWYKNGIKDGTLNAFYQNGRLWYTYSYANDRIDGYYREYYNKGSKKEIRLYEKDSLLYYELFDSLGNFTKDFRKITIDCKSDTIILGNAFRALIELKGPKIGKIEYSAVDALPSELKVKEVYSKFLPIVASKGIYEFKPTKPGSYVILGSIRIKYDSITYPRYYYFKKKFFVKI